MNVFFSFCFKVGERGAVHVDVQGEYARLLFLGAVGEKCHVINSKKSSLFAGSHEHELDSKVASFAFAFQTDRAATIVPYYAKAFGH